jgi:hypothetical protein
VIIRIGEQAMRTAPHFRNLFLATSFAVLASTATVLAEDTPPQSAPATSTENTPTANPSTESENSAQNTTQTDADDKIICKKEPPPVGSRMGGRKVCRTVAEWRRIQAIARETTDEIQNRKVPPPTN